MGASVVSVSLMSADGIVREHAVEPGDFRYRRSFMRSGEVVLEVTLKLEPGDPEVIRAETDRINRMRAASQPKGGHSSGCIFKNPEGDGAGRLVDACGLKGLRRGGAVVSAAHGNFIVNDGSATADDILGLIEDIRTVVKAKSGVELDLEVVVWRGAP
jgi:UDP-N-acetylmuramate dehydrogenase